MKFNATATHGDGVIPKTNTGKEVASLQIKAGTKSASKTIYGYRNMFYVADTNAASGAPADSASVRALTNKQLNPTNGTKINLTIPQGCTRVVIAYPATLRDITSIIQASTNMSALGSFNKTEVSVDGANAYTAANYKVYTYTSLAPLNADTFNVTI